MSGLLDVLVAALIVEAGIAIAAALYVWRRYQLRSADSVVFGRLAHRDLRIAAAGIVVIALAIAMLTRTSVGEIGLAILVVTIGILLYGPISDAILLWGLARQGRPVDGDV